MKTFSIILKLCFTFSIIFFAACNKDVIIEESSSVQSNIRSSNVDCDIDNVPGELHNLGVEYVLSFESELAALSDDETMFRTFVSEKIDEFINSLDLSYYNLNDPGGFDWSFIYEPDLNEYFINEFGPVLNANEENIVAEFKLAISDVDILTAEGLEDLIDQTELFQCNLTNYESLESEEKLSGYFSVFSHSAQLWTTYLTESGNSELVNGPVMDVINEDADGLVCGWKSTGDPVHAVRSAIAFSVVEFNLHDWFF